MYVFFSRLVRLLSIDGQIKSEAIVLVSVLPLKFQDNPEYKSVLPFRIILNIFAMNMLVIEIVLSDFHKMTLMVIKHLFTKVAAHTHKVQKL